MLSCCAKNHENLVCVKFIVFRGRVRADPRRQDQLVPMGCANTKIMQPWFEPNISLFRARVGADPRRQDQLVPMGCACEKIVGQGASWSKEAGSTRTLELCARKNHEPLVCAKYFSVGQGTS